MHVVESETRLVEEACQGSVTAFERLLIIYEPRIRRMIYGMTQDVQLTQDLCQETFLSVYRALPRMLGKNLNFSSWLYRIALNVVRSEWRRRKHVTVVPFSQFASNEDNQFDEPLAEQHMLLSTDLFEERVVKQDLVRRVLAQLPESSALCLLLDAEGFTYNEIADILQDSLAAVRSRLSRARQAFQRIYSHLDQEG